VRIAGRVLGGTANFVHIGPTGTQPAGNLRLIVAGATDTTGGVTLGTDAKVTALVVSRASFSAGDRFAGKGVLAAKNVRAREWRSRSICCESSRFCSEKSTDKIS
jgi:hypothetical protein